MRHARTIWKTKTRGLWGRKSGVDIESSDFLRRPKIFGKIVHITYLENFKSSGRFRQISVTFLENLNFKST